MTGLKIKGNKIIAVAAAVMLTMSESFCVYRRKSDTDIDIVSAASGEYKTWKQSDSRWGDMLLGSSTDTMRKSGCATTALASLVVHAGFRDESDFDPGVFCKIISENNGYDKNGNIMWWTVSKAAKGFTFVDTVYMYGSKYEERVEEIKSYLDKGYYIIADVKYSGHWVAIDRIEDGIVYSIDPAANTSSNLFEQYDFKGNTRLKLFDAYGKAGPLPEPPKPPEEEKVYETGTYIITTNLNIREGKSSSTVKLGEFEAGTRVEVTEVSGCWGKVSYNGRDAYICLDYAVIVTEPEEPAPPVDAGEKIGAYQTNDVLNFRENPGVIHKSYGLIPSGTKLNVYEIKENWGRTRYNGETGWICLDYADYLSHDFVMEGLVSTPSVTTMQVTDLPVQTEVTTSPVSEAVTSYEETQITETVTQTAAVSTEEVISSATEPQRVFVPGCYRTTDALNFRTGAGTSNPVMCVLSEGTEVFVSVVSGNWGMISFKGYTGWICLDYTEEYDPSEVTVTTQLPEVTAGVTETTDTVVIVTTAFVPDFSVIRGDVDEDGSVNIVDFIKLKSILSDKCSGTQSADINGDGSVTSADLLAWMKMYIR